MCRYPASSLDTDLLKMRNCLEIDSTIGLLLIKSIYTNLDFTILEHTIGFL